MARTAVLCRRSPTASHDALRRYGVRKVCSCLAGWEYGQQDLQTSWELGNLWPACPVQCKS